MMERKNQLLLSYSGLKTAVSHALRDMEKNMVRKEDIAWSFQEEALGQIVRKLSSARTIRPGSKSVIVAGGVAANSRFKELMASLMPLPAYFPPLKYCSDNGAMIASMAYYQGQAGLSSAWDVYSRYPFERFLAKDL
jgi:N6-L-threonylcarbamoyladenine synthase